jgi:hypothetical protein
MNFFYKKDNGIKELENKISLFSMLTLQVENLVFIYTYYTVIYLTEILYKLCVEQNVQYLFVMQIGFKGTMP